LTERPRQSLSRYRLGEKIGEGGMGVVYQATDVELQREVAIKFIFEASLAKRGRGSFLREARLAAALNHPNICTVHEVGEVGDHDSAEFDDGVRISAGTPYLVMELIEGPPLALLLQDTQSSSLDEILDIAGQVAEALAAAHGRGIVHRDLKPQNVVLTPSGRIKIVDFGLAKALGGLGGGESAASEALTVTRPNRLAGTPAYMSPEQATGLELDTRSDVFSFGTMLYELLSGQHPFAAESIPVTQARIVEAEAQELTSLRPDVPAELARIVGRCLQKRPDRRYNDTRDLVNSIRDLRTKLRRSTADGPPESAEQVTGFTGPAHGAFARWQSQQSIPGLKLESYAQILDFVLGRQEESGSWPGEGDHWSEVKTACILKAVAQMGFQAEDQWWVGERGSGRIGGPSKSLDFLAGRLTTLGLAEGIAGEDIWDTCQALLALAAFGRREPGAQYANHINHNWREHYRDVCESIPANSWAGPSYLAAMCDVLVSYEAVLDSASRVDEIFESLESLEHTENGRPVGCFRAATSVDPNKHRWNTGLTLRSLGSSPAAPADLLLRASEWLLNELEHADQWLGATDRESPMYLARCMAGLLATAPRLSPELGERIHRAFEQGNTRLDGFWSPNDSQRTGDLKSYSAVLEYLAAWKLTVPAGLVLGMSPTRGHSHAT
jgi:serine/threonine protein kinase